MPTNPSQNDPFMGNPHLPNPLHYDNQDDYFDALVQAELEIKEWEEDYGTILTNLQKMPLQGEDTFVATPIIKKSPSKSSIVPTTLSSRYNELKSKHDLLAKRSYTQDDLLGMIKGVCKSLDVTCNLKTNTNKSMFLSEFSHFIWANLKTNEQPDPEDC